MRRHVHTAMAHMLMVIHAESEILYNYRGAFNLQGLLERSAFEKDR